MLLLTLCTHAHLGAAEIKVNSLADSGAGSLRSAVAGAAEGDTIVLRAEGTLVLQSPIAIQRGLTISGQGGPLAHVIAGGGGNRLFEVAPGKAVILSRLTLEGGATGGNGAAVLSAGQLTLDRVRILNSTAGGDGGAVFQNGGSLSVEGSFFAGNTATGSGGAIAAVGSSLVVASAGFEANAAGLTGGGIQAGGGSLEVRNSTFVNNAATLNGGGVALIGGSGTAVNLTLVGNTTHIAVEGGSLTIGNSILEGTGAQLPGTSGTLLNSGNNLAGSLGELGLGGYGDHGGVSPTFPLEPGSPAIDAGSNALAAGRDQRGLARFSDGDGDGSGDTVDLGAFEIQHYKVSALQIFGSATGGEDDAGYGNPFDPSDDALSISSADVFAKLTAAGKADIGDAVGANNAAGGGSVSFSGQIIPGAIFLKGSQLEARRDLAIYGPGANRLSVNGDARSRILRTSAGARVFVSGLSLENGAADRGAAILVESGAAVQLEGVSLSGNKASVSGGAIAVLAGQAQVYRSSLVGNSAGQQGGAVSAAEGTGVFIDNSTLSYNTAGSQGGAIWADGFLSVESSTLVGNTTGSSAPGLRLDLGGNGNLWNSVFLHGGAASIELADAADTVASSGHNLSDAVEPALPVSAYQVVTRPPVGPLALNGGTTLSHAPVSPEAINTGDNSNVAALDQPGLARVRGGVIDIGSVEFQNDPPFITCLEAPASIECATYDTTSVAVTICVDDLDGDAMSVTWTLNGVEVTDTVAAGSAMPAVLTRTFGLPFGPSEISVVARDAYSASAAYPISITVGDTTVPDFSFVPGDVSAPVDALLCTAEVSFAASASDSCSGLKGITYTSTNAAGVVAPISSPHAFAIGTHVVTCTAEDVAGNIRSAAFTVTAYDGTAPALSVPADMDAVADPSLCTASVAFAASVGPDCSGLASILYQLDGSPIASPHAFPLGVHQVLVTARDGAGNTSTGSFTVTVRDLTPPVFTALPADFEVETDPGYCSARISFAATAQDPCSGIASITYSTLDPEGLTETITSPHRFAPGTHMVTVTALDAAGNSATDAFTVTVTDPYLNCLSNVSWPNALPLEFTEGGGNTFAEARQFLALTDQARWYRFSVQPGSRVTVILSELPANFDIVVYRDIHAEYQRLLNLFNSGDPNAQELALLGVEFAPESFSPESFSPESFSPESFSPESFSPESFSPESFSPESFSPESFSPESFSPESFSPESFSPESFSPESFSPESFSPESFSPESFSPESFSPEFFTPESFSPESFSAAQVSSIVAYSAYPGVASEGVSINTFTVSGDFYVRVRGSNGAFSVEAPFKVSVIVEPEICEGVQGPDAFPDAVPVTHPGDYQTIVLWDSLRTPGTEAERAALAEQLETFAARPEVAGIVVDLKDDARVYAANQQADGLPGCPYSKNLVAGEIKAVIDAWRVDNPSLQYIVLLGNDDAIPFFRTTDEAFLANEANYVPPVRDNTHSQSSLRYGQILTQDPYGADCQLSLVTGPFPYPNLAIGRLVESAADISAQIDNYLATAAGVLPVPQSALVTGYDFLDDAARAVQFEFEQGLGGPIDTLIADATLAPSEGWTATDLAEAFLGSRHDLVFLAGHFSTGSSLAADYVTRLTAAQVLASDADLLNSLIFSIGCHSGYNTVDAHAITGITKQPDWAQTFAKMGAILIAGTGYQYGDTEFIEYSERLYLEFARQLRTGSGPVAIGQALNQAKRRYLAETPLMRGIHEKSLVQATLFGFPMLKVNLPGARLTDSLSGTDLAVAPATVGANPGKFFGLQTADVQILPELTPKSLDLKDIISGGTVTARWFEGRQGLVSNPVEPVRPLETYRVSVDGTLLRGIGFRGGDYQDLADFLPLTGAPTTEIRGVYGNFFSEVFFPVQPYSLNVFGAICGGQDGERLNVYPAQFLATGGGALGGTMRTYAAMDFRLFYNNNRETYTNAGGDAIIPALAPAPSIAKVRSAEAGGGTAVRFDIHVLGSPAAGIQEVWVTYTGVPGSPLHGAWQSLDLLQNLTDTTLWSGELALPAGTSSDQVRFMVQAASGIGLVALSTNLGRYFEVGVDEQAARIPTLVSLEDPVPSAGAYGESVPLKARLTTQSGDPLAGKRVGFRIGTSRVLGFTGADGFVEVVLPLTTRPGAALLQAYFEGDRTHAPSAVGLQFQVAKQDTVLTFDPAIPAPPARVPGSAVVVSLMDAIGTPLKERTVFFLIDYGSFRIGNSVITDISGRADLSEVFLPPGDATVTAYFNGEITLPDGSTVLIDDQLYHPAPPVSLAVSFAQSVQEDSLGFDPQQVDVYYKSAGSRGNNASVPVYQSASIAGDLAFNVPIQPGDILRDDPDPSFVEARVEARLAGQLIAAESFLLDTRGNNSNHWTTASRPGAQVSYAGIHWSDAPRFDSALSDSPGPRISTIFIGNNFTEFRYEPVPGSGNYRTEFPQGISIAVNKDGAINLAGCVGLKEGEYAVDAGGITFDARFGLVPGMVFTTRDLSKPNPQPDLIVAVVEGVNYLREGGRMIVRLAAVEGTPMPASNATPNLFEFRFILGNAGGDQVQVRSVARIGDALNAVPWSSEDPGHKQYRP